MSETEDKETPPKPDKRKFFVTIHYKGQKRRGRVNISTTEQLKNVIYAHYKIKEKENHIIYYYSYRDKRWEEFPEERGVLPDDLRLVIKENQPSESGDDPIITTGPAAKDDDSRPGPPTRTPSPLPPDLARDLPKRTFIMSLYYKDVIKRGPVTADRNDTLLRVLFQAFKVRGLENFLIEYHSPKEKKWVPFPIPEHILRARRMRKQILQMREQGSLKNQETTTTTTETKKIEPPKEVEEEKKEDKDDEKEPKEKEFISSELPERLHLLLVDRPKDPSVDLATLPRPERSPYPGADQVVRKIRNEMKIKRFTILLYYKDAKKKGRISVEHTEDLKKLVFETFDIKYPSDNHVLEFLTEPEKDTKLTPEERALGGKWIPIPDYDPRTPVFKNTLTEDEKKMKEKEFYDLPDPIKLLVRDVKAHPRLELTKLEIPSDWTEYHNEKFGISVMHPPNFQFFVFDFPGQPLTSVTFVNPAQPLGQVVLMLEDHVIKLAVEEYHEKSMMSLRMMSGSVVNVADPLVLKAGAGGLALPEGAIELDPSTGKKMKCHKGIITRFRVKNFQSMGQTFHVWQGAVTNTFSELRSFLVQNISPQHNDPNVKVARLMYHSLKIFQPEFLGRLSYHSLYGRVKIRIPTEDWYITREMQTAQSKTGIIFQGTLLDRKAIDAEKMKRLKEKQEKLALLPTRNEDPKTGEILLTEEDIEEINAGLMDISSDVVWKTKVLGGIRIMQHSGSVAVDEADLLETFRKNYDEHGKVHVFEVNKEKDPHLGLFEQEGFHSAIKILKFKHVEIERERVNKNTTEQQQQQQQEQQQQEKEKEDVEEESMPPTPGELMNILSDALDETEKITSEQQLESEKIPDEDLIIHSSDEEEDVIHDDFEIVEKEVETEFYYSIVLQSKISKEDLMKNLVKKVVPSIRPFDPHKMRAIRNEKKKREYGMRDQDFIRYTNPDFNFSLDYPVGMEIKEHADSDPVVTILSPKLTMDGKVSKNHFEIAVSCRAAPMELTLHEVYTMLKEQYRSNRDIKMLSLKRDERNQCVVSYFRQKPEGVVPVNIDQEHRRDQLFSLNFYVTSFLLTKTKTATLRTVCLEENTSKEGYLELFKMIHSSIHFDVDKVKDNPNYKPIVM